MTDIVKAAFAPTIVELQLAELLPTRQVSQQQREGVKFRRIASSMAEVGLVEPLVVARQSHAASYLLLDGHLRLDALRELGVATARCLVADDDEAFTYNKRINRLAPIQEHHMIVRALERGVAPEKLARALDVDVKVIKLRRNMLAGIAIEVVELLQEKPIGENALKHLRKMKPLRQLEIAELMVSANNFSANYSRALLATTKPADLLKPERQAKATGLSPEQMARLEREMVAVNDIYKALEASYGDDVLDLVVASGFLDRLLSKPEIERFLADRHPEFLETFRSIVSATSLDQAGAAA